MFILYHNNPLKPLNHPFFMVRLYLNKTIKGKKQYLDFNIWSLVKSYFLSGLLLGAIVWGTIIVLFFIIAILMALVGFR